MTENTLRVLIIDDEPAIRKLLKISMQAYGYELFYPQIGVGKRLDGGRRRVKKYLWSF